MLSQSIDQEDWQREKSVEGGGGWAGGGYLVQTVCSNLVSSLWSQMKSTECLNSSMRTKEPMQRVFY
jgi:hypothetical protein